MMESRIQQRRKINERKAEWFRDYLHVNMDTMKIPEVKDHQICKNSPKVIAINEKDAPAALKEKRNYSTDS